MKKSSVIVLVALAIVGVLMIFVFPFMNATPVEASAEENAQAVAEYVFEKGEIQFITSVATTNYRYWEAKVYFPTLERSHIVIIPDSVLDDISVGWEGYFGFRPDYSYPQWVGLNYNP